MSGFDGFLGNNRLKERLMRDIAAGRLAHAYIIEGAAGTGKRTLARLIACAVACESDDAERPCMKCIRYSKILRGQSPDVIMVEPERDRVQLGVDVIRRVREDAMIAPNDLTRKFYIIPRADIMNVQAQNALLKILEEPPPAVMFLILCENAEELLSTIRSRAPSLRIEALPSNVIEAYLLEHDANAASLAASDPDALKAVIKLAAGSLGRAIELCDPESAAECLALYKKAEQYISLLSERRDASGELRFYEFASKLVARTGTAAKQRDELSSIYSLLADAARDLAVLKLAGDPGLIFWIDTDTARTLSERFTAATLLRLTDLFSEAADLLGRNVSVASIQANTACRAAAAGRTK